MKKLHNFLFSIVLLGLSIGIMGTPSHAQGPRKITVVAKRFAFEPSTVTIKKGEPVVLVIQSTDVAHGIRFRDLNAETNIAAKGTAELPIKVDMPGDYVGHCAVFCGSGHGSMTLTLHVVE